MVQYVVENTFLHYHLNFLPRKLEDTSEPHGARFYQDICTKTWGNTTQENWNPLTEKRRISRYVKKENKQKIILNTLNVKVYFNFYYMYFTYGY